MLADIQNLKQRLGSFSSAKVGALFAEMAQRVVTDRDPDIANYIDRVLGAITEPVPALDDAMALDARHLDEDRLAAAYEQHRRQKQEHHALFDSVIGEAEDDPALLRRITETVARIGHLVKAGSPFAHENVIHQGRAERDTIFENYRPGVDELPDIKNATSLEYYILTLLREGYAKNVDEVCEAISKVVISIVITGHPTRYLTTEFGDVREDFIAAARHVANPAKKGEPDIGLSAIYDVLNKFLDGDRTPLTHTAPDGGPVPLTPLGEIMGFASNIHMLFDTRFDEIFRKLDDAMQRVFGMGYGPEQREKLTFSLLFPTWIMGDKDGNKVLRSEHLLLASVIYHREAAMMYGRQVRELEESHGMTGQAPNGQRWSDYFDGKATVINDILAPLLKRIDEEGGGVDLPLTREEFTSVLDRMQDVYRDAGGTNDAMATFQQHLETHIGVSHAYDVPAYMSLLRKARIVPLSMTNFQLRETADEFPVVLATLLKDKVDYAALSKEDKLEYLNGLMTSGAGHIRDIPRQYQESLAARGISIKNLRDYDNEKNPDVITLHTLQRMEIGARQPGLITDQIMAECKGELELMEALAITRMVGLRVLIVPLLEERDTLTEAGPMFAKAFQYRAWRDHMWDMAGEDPTKLIYSLKAMYAHSDNMRRMGQPAARANIYDQARNHVPLKMREEFPALLTLLAQDGRIKSEDIPAILEKMEDNPTAYEMKQFHGGSKCDGARGGVRSTLGLIRDAFLAWFHQETIQGADPGEMMQDGRPARFLTTIIGHNAVYIQESLHGKTKAWNRKREGVMRELIDTTIDSYENNHYPDQLGELMGLFGYKINEAYNKPGCRGARNAGSERLSCAPDALGPLAPDKIRTIDFTTGCADAGLSPSALPMRGFLAALNAKYAADQELRDDLAKDAKEIFGSDEPVFEDGLLTLLGYKTLNKASPTYRAAVIDFTSFGVGTSDPELSVQFLKEREARGSLPATQSPLDYLDKSVPKDFMEAAQLGMYAMGYEMPKGFITSEKMANPDAETCSRLSFLMRKVVFPHLEEPLYVGERLHHFGRMLREKLIAKGIRDKDKVFSTDAAYMLRLTAVLRSLYHHVFYDGGFDPSTAKRQMQLRRKENFPVAAVA